MGTIAATCVSISGDLLRQTYEWRQAIGFCMKKAGDNLLVATSSLAA